MTAPVLSAQIAPHSPECAAVLALVLVFLIIEIPLIVSIFRNGSKDERPKETDK
jgi:hypothetical protein